MNNHVCKCNFFVLKLLKIVREMLFPSRHNQRLKYLFPPSPLKKKQKNFIKINVFHVPRVMYRTRIIINVSS